MRSIWGGAISFGLVNIPIKIYSAIKEHVLGFKLLCKKCHTPINYQRWCPHCNKQVAWDDTVKGLELSKNNYFILTQEKLHQLRPEKTETLAIKEFIDISQLQPIYIEKHFYIGPEKSGEKSYFLFKEALEQTNKVAIGQFVMRDKEYICAILPYDQGLLLSTLNYDYEIRDINKITELETEPKLDTKELQLAKQLINQLTSKKFDLSKYKDTFAEQLAKEIKKSKKTKIPLKIQKREAKPKKEKESNLIASLRKSLTTPSRRTEQPIAQAKKR